MRAAGRWLCAGAVVLSLLIVFSNVPEDFAAVPIVMLAGGVALLVRTKKLVLEPNENLKWGPESALRNWSVLNSQDHCKVALSDAQLLFGSYFSRETAHQALPFDSISSVSKAGMLSAKIRSADKVVTFRFQRGAIRDAFVQVLISEGVRENAGR